jgi:hypothetical protein
MDPRELFPINRLPPKAREAVLTEFHGCCPTVLEVARLPDTHWLKVPNMGLSSIAKLRSLTFGVCQTTVPATLTGLSDLELLSKSKILRNELRRVQEDLKAHRTELRMRGISLADFRMSANES